ncbi:MAG: TetR/AcrR family transcriptional regulator, partial [Myxococcales bacterium]|nr:TetR/AcrR family transcriptional regulator [Myxococcales bacterium]
GMSSESPNSTSAGRPRSEEAHRAILDATLELLVEVGFSALTVEGVATRAGVGKATIYRRWPSKLPLVIEAFRELPQLEEVDTGNLVDDLKKMLRSYLQLFHSTPLGTVLPSLAGERAHEPQLSQLFDPVVKARSQPLVRALRRAVKRGELPADLDLELAADLIVGPIAVRLFFSGGKVSPKMVGPMVDLALRGIAPDCVLDCHRKVGFNAPILAFLDVGERQTPVLVDLHQGECRAWNFNILVFEQRADHARQHVAGAARRHARVPGLVDVEALPVRDDRAAPFQNRHAAIRLDQRAGVCAQRARQDVEP